MTGFLLDTNCISEDVTARPNVGVSKWLSEVDSGLLYISVLTLGEIRKGIVGLAPGVRRSRLESWYRQDLPLQFANRILPVTSSIAERWGELDMAARRRSRILPVIDGLLAATAMEHHLTIASRNVRDFQAAQVAVFSPWT